MKRNRKLILILVLLLVVIAVSIILLLRKPHDIRYANPGDIVELSFEMDKKIEFGEYYFDINNGKGATYPLCFCLTEKNTYPPDCSGDVKYMYKNQPGTMCIPMSIGKGRCSVASIKTMGYATGFIIPLEYSWTKPFQKIVLGIRVPREAPDGARLSVAITIYKQNNGIDMTAYRMYEKTIVVKQKSNS